MIIIELIKLKRAITRTSVNIRYTATSSVFSILYSVSLSCSLVFTSKPGPNLDSNKATDSMVFEGSLSINSTELNWFLL